MPLIICLTKISLVLKIGSISPMKGNFKKGGNFLLIQDGKEERTPTKQKKYK